MKKKNAVALGLFLTMAMSMPASAIDCSNAHRIDGSDRVKTSLESAKMVESKVLVLASGYSYADSLSASNVVLKTGGKLVLVGEKTDVAALLKGNNYEKIYIVGGEKTLPKSVEESAKKLSKNVIRLSGANRYGTNEKTLNEFKLNDVGVADGENYPDALSASALLKDKNLGLLLVNGVKPYKTNHNVKYTFGYSVKQDAGKRLAGRDRYATNLAVLNELGRKDNIAIASGEVFPDALSAINVVTAKDASVVLVRNNTNKISKDLNDYIEKAKDAYILGGTKTISKDVAKFLICENKTETPSYSGGGGGGGSHSSSRPVDYVLDAFDDGLDRALSGIKIPNDAALIDTYRNEGDRHTKKVYVLDPEANAAKFTGTNAMVELKKLANQPLFDGYNLSEYQIENYDPVNLEGLNDKDTTKANKAMNDVKERIIEDFTRFVELKPGDEVKLGKFLEPGKNKVHAKAVLKDKEGNTRNIYYTVEFIGGKDAENFKVQDNFDSALTEALHDAQKKLPDSVKLRYDSFTRQANVDITQKEAPLTSIKNTGLMNSLEKLVKEDILVSYQIEGAKEPTVLEGMSTVQMQEAIINDFAKALKIDKNDLTLGKFVEKKEMKADVVLKPVEGTEPIHTTYKVVFTDTQGKYEQLVKRKLSEAVEESIGKINVPDGLKVEDGFADNTKVVTINKPEKLITSVKDTNAIVELNGLLDTNELNGYKLKSYKIINPEDKDSKNEVSFYGEDGAKLSGEKLKEEILVSFAKAAKVEKGAARFGDFAGKTITAEVVLEKDGREIKDNYSVKFELSADDLQKNFDSDLASILDPANNKIKIPEGVDFKYDPANKEATVTVKNGDLSINKISGTNLIAELINLRDNKFLTGYEIDEVNGKVVGSIVGLDAGKIKEQLANDLSKAIGLGAGKNATLDDALKNIGKNGLSAKGIIKAGDVNTETPKYTVKFVNPKEEQKTDEEENNYGLTSFNDRTDLGVRSYVLVFTDVAKDDNGNIVKVTKPEDLKKLVKTIQIEDNLNNHIIDMSNPESEESVEFIDASKVIGKPGYENVKKDSLVVRVLIGGVVDEGKTVLKDKQRVTIEYNGEIVRPDGTGKINSESLVK